MKRYTYAICSLLFVLALAACGGADTTAPPATVAVVDSPTDAPPATATTAAPAEPTAAPVTEPTSEPPTAEPPTAEPVPATLCPDLPRPALIVSNGPAYEALNPLTGERCSLPLPEGLGYLQPAGERLYFVQMDNDASQSAVTRLNPDGSIEPLEATRVAGDVHYLLRFAVAGDGSRLAWSAMQPQADPNAPELPGSLWIGAADGSDPVTVYEAEVGGPMRIISPIRFTAGGDWLYFSWEPIGLGGMWASFNGRYDNLYRVPSAGGAPEKVYDCADAGLFLCIGDFMDDGTLAYIDTDLTIHVVGADGAETAAIPSAAEYAGYPTFSPGGDLFYSEATLPAGDQAAPIPSPGTVYRVAAPYTGAPAVVASTDGLLTAATGRPFMDADHLVVGYAEGDMWGNALLSAAGEIIRLEPWPNAYLATVWPE